MTLEPRAIDIPRIPRVLKLYQVMSFVTGSFLLLLVAEVITKWELGYELEMGGAYGFIALVARARRATCFSMRSWRRGASPT